MAQITGSKTDFEYCLEMKDICSMFGSFKPHPEKLDRLLEKTKALKNSGPDLPTYERLIVDNRLWAITVIKDLIEDKGLGADDDMVELFDDLTDSFGILCAFIPKCTMNTDDKAEFIDEAKSVYDGYKMRTSMSESNIKILFSYMEGEALHLLYKYAPGQF